MLGLDRIVLIELRERQTFQWTHTLTFFLRKKWWWNGPNCVFSFSIWTSKDCWCWFVECWTCSGVATYQICPQCEGWMSPLQAQTAVCTPGESWSGASSKTSQLRCMSNLFRITGPNFLDECNICRIKICTSAHSGWTLLAQSAVHWKNDSTGSPCGFH